MPRPRTVLITGCSTGIGRALALAMADAGCEVFASARRPETLADIARDNLHPLQLDVLDGASIQAALAKVYDRAGRVDMLVNNAGLSVTAPLVETDLARLQGVIDTNLTGCIAMIQAIFPHMADAGGGRIVNVGSVVGELPVPFTATYCATKAGLHMLSDVLRMEVHPFGIDVVTVQPAAVSTEIEARSGEGVEAFASEQSRYHRFYQSIRKRFEGQDGSAMSAADFAAHITPQLLAEKAPRVVHGGGKNGMLRALARLPAGVRDKLMRNEYGLQ
ncbi:SDR family oxidoreductase [Pseudohalioglobus sediminis]|uniref:SDR family oxidoreductase n=1 Tax=Pseudohalioglobus sediminis TaxID=2606449 RepID=A0A5B0X1I5_9GAMM|nr:SDR family oxidoreductase [Pseudohalioglobus sediminis]KAA1192508.1 SDR family oxidoreductase [Pseudohalioglobus sediminis]